MPDRGDVSSKAAIPTNLSATQNLAVGLISSSVEQKGFYLRIGKRLIDIFLSHVGLILFAPMLVVISVLLKISSPGPVLFRQRRVGRNGNEFWILKFRSMVYGAERMGNGITPGNDPRVTSLGAFLRKWKLDELPQLWNVLKGEMSFVGPRPEVPSYVAEYSREQRVVLRVRPGITDPASLRYRNEARILQNSEDPERLYREKILPDKLALNLQYLKDISFAYDLSLILSTVKSVASFSKSTE